MSVQELMPTLDDIETIRCVYFAKEDGCRCGCGGTYYYPSQRTEEAGQARGYPLKPEEINDEEFQRIINHVRMYHDKIDDWCSAYVNLTMANGNVYTVHFRNSKEKS